MRTFTYLIGEPGVGKSTLMDSILYGHRAYPMKDPVPHIVYDDGSVAQIGAQRAKFSGTDALSMSIQPAVTEWLMQRPYQTLLAEGDRLANDKFFRAVKAAGYELRLICLTATPGRLSVRRASRMVELGLQNAQSPAWLAGRATKIRNLIPKWEPLVIQLDTIQQAEQEIVDFGWHPFIHEDEEIVGRIEATP
jgi:hypothetical protein